MANNQRFWVVAPHSSHQPRYGTRGEAEARAISLLGRYPHQTYLVLELVSGHIGAEAPEMAETIIKAGSKVALRKSPTILRGRVGQVRVDGAWPSRRMYGIKNVGRPGEELWWVSGQKDKLKRGPDDLVPFVGSVPE